MDRDDNPHDEKLFGDLPYIPHSSWRYDLDDRDESASRSIDAEEFWDRLGL